MKIVRNILAFIGAVNCLVVSILFISYPLEVGDSIWTIFPLPGFYFLEIILLGFIGFIATIQGKAKILWSICGILAVLIFLGAWTIGLPLIAAELIFIFLAIQISQKKYFNGYFLSFISGFLIQAGLMIALIFLLKE